MRTIALDVGKFGMDWCEVHEGKVVGRGHVKGEEELKELFLGGSSKVHVGFEACRQARHLHDTFTSWGCKVTLIDTTRVREMGVGSHGRKNDWIDAEKMAIALERGYVAEAHVMSDVARELRELQEVHRQLTRTRAQMTAHIRGLAQGRGVLIPSCPSEDLAGRLRESSFCKVSEPLGVAVEPLLCVLEILTPQLAEIDLRIQALCETQPDPVVNRLASVPGVSVLVAAAFVSVVDGPERFKSASQVASYLGLCPSESTTGGHRRLGSITQQGNAHLRGMLIQAAWCILRSKDLGDRLVRWGHRLAVRRGRMRAAVAVARRLSRVLFRIWKDGTFYDPKDQPKLAHRQAAAEEPSVATKTPAERQQQTRILGMQKLAKRKRENERHASRGRHRGSRHKAAPCT